MKTLSAIAIIALIIWLADYLANDSDGPDDWPSPPTDDKDALP